MTSKYKSYIFHWLVTGKEGGAAYETPLRNAVNVSDEGHPPKFSST